MSKNPKKVYVILSDNPDYAMGTAWVQYPNGNLSHLPNEKETQKILLVDTLKEANYPVYTQSILASMTGGSSNHQSHCPTDKIMGNTVEIPLTLAAADADGFVRIGLHDEGFADILGIAAEQDVTVGGLYGTETIQVLGQLAHQGKLTIHRIHSEANTVGFYSKNMRKGGAQINSDKVGQKTIYWAKATSKDENITIRDQYFQKGEADFCGLDYLEVPVPKNTSSNLVVYAEWNKCK